MSSDEGTYARTETERSSRTSPINFLYKLVTRRTRNDRGFTVGRFTCLVLGVSRIVQNGHLSTYALPFSRAHTKRCEVILAPLEIFLGFRQLLDPMLKGGGVLVAGIPLGNGAAPTDSFASSAARCIPSQKQVPCCSPAALGLQRLPSNGRCRFGRRYTSPRAHNGVRRVLYG